MQASTTVKNYDNFKDACEDVIQTVSHLSSKTQTQIQANFEGRSFTVKTERGGLINPEIAAVDDPFLREAVGVHKRKVKVTASEGFNVQDVEYLSEMFCRAFGTELVTVSIEAK